MAIYADRGSVLAGAAPSLMTRTNKTKVYKKKKWGKGAQRPVESSALVALRARAAWLDVPIEVGTTRFIRVTPVLVQMWVIITQFGTCVRCLHIRAIRAQSLSKKCLPPIPLTRCGVVRCTKSIGLHSVDCICLVPAHVGDAEKYSGRRAKSADVN